jgi:hypothetical protein
MSTSTVTSEALQLKLRQLLPSQQGFGTDLSASDTIIPIIDLTAAAEGSDVSEVLQEAFSFPDLTRVEAVNNSQTIANSPGFYRLIVNASLRSEAGQSQKCSITMTDGATTKTLWSVQTQAANDSEYDHQTVILTVFLAAGDTVTAVSNSSSAFCDVSSRQIATSNGTLVQPTGFTPQ